MGPPSMEDLETPLKGGTDTEGKIISFELQPFPPLDLGDLTTGIGDLPKAGQDSVWVYSDMIRDSDGCCVVQPEMDVGAAPVSHLSTQTTPWQESQEPCPCRSYYKQYYNCDFFFSMESRDRNSMSWKSLYR